MEAEGMHVNVDAEKAVPKGILQPTEPRRREGAQGQNDPWVAPEENPLYSADDGTTSVADEDVIQTQRQKDEQRIQEEQAPQVKEGTSADTTSAQNPLRRDLECTEIRWYRLHQTRGLEPLKGKDSIVIEIKFRLNEGIDLDPQGKAIHDEHLADLNILAKDKYQQGRSVTVLKGYYEVNADNTTITLIVGAKASGVREWFSYDEKLNTMKLVKPPKISRKIDKHLDTIPESEDPIPFPLTIQCDGDTIKWISVDYVEFQRKGCNPLYLIRGNPMEETPRDVKIQRGVWFVYDEKMGTVKPVSPEIANRIENHLDKSDLTTEKSFPKPLIVKSFTVKWESVELVMLEIEGSEPVPIVPGQGKETQRRVWFLLDGSIIDSEISISIERHLKMFKPKLGESGEQVPEPLVVKRVEYTVKWTSPDDCKLLMGSESVRIVRGHPEKAQWGDGNSEVKHLIFYTHGIANNKKEYSTVMATKKLAKGVDAQLKKDDIRQIMFLPIHWRSLLKIPEDHKCRRTTFPSTYIGVMRRVVKIMHGDLKLYECGECKQNIRAIVISKLNSLFKKFQENNPAYNGPISLLGHSLGSVIFYDILAKKSNLLHFTVSKLFIVGSPLRYFLSMRGLSAIKLFRDFVKSKKVLNTYHPNDLIAAKLKRLIGSEQGNFKLTDHRLPRKISELWSHSIYVTHPDFHRFLIKNTISDEELLKAEKLLDVGKEQVQPNSADINIPSAADTPTVSNNMPVIVGQLDKLVITTADENVAVTSQPVAV